MATLAEVTLIPIPDDPGLHHTLGILSALASMLCWVITSMAFTTAGRRYGTTTVNVTRSLLAMVLILVMVKALSGSFMPFPEDTRLLWLALSGIAGLAIGDQLIFAAFNRIGPRLTLLILNLAPVATALIAWPVLGEPLHMLGWLGMVITIAGVSAVISEGDAPKQEKVEGGSMLFNAKLGITLALSGVIAVSIGNVLAKLGMLPATSDAGQGTGVDPLVAQDARMIAGAVMIVVMACLAGLTGRRIGTPPEPDPSRRPARWLAIGSLGVGTILGPVFGIFFFLYSAALIEVGVTATIVALTPVAILPFNRLIEGSNPSTRAIIGAVVGVLGVGMLALGTTPDMDGGEAADGPSTSIESVEFPP
ncbi:MAG: DMT family transporter [Phycisphaerales bacterium]|nr:DMT family transporter [Phycisphaerales bacterium]